jgi:hypothetical protein
VKARKGNPCILILVLLFMLPLREAHGEEAYCGKIIRASGTVEVQKKGIKGTIPGIQGLLLYPQDLVRTDESGLCVCAFEGGSQVIINGRSSLMLRSGTQIELFEGQVSGQLRGESAFSIVTSSAEATSKDGDTEMILSCTRSNHLTTCAVLSGESTIANALGSLQLTSMQRGSSAPGGAPRRGKDLSEEELEEYNRRIDFGRPSLVIFIYETHLGIPQKESLIQEDLEKLLETGHFQVIKRGSIKDFGDSSLTNLKKSAYGGDPEAARMLAGEVEAEIYLVGDIRTALLGEVGKGIVSCSAQGQIKGYLTHSRELLFSRVVNSTSIEKSRLDASRKAMAKALSDLDKTLVWDLNQSLADLIKPVDELFPMDLLVYKDPLLGKKIIVEKLKRIPSVVRYSSGQTDGEKTTYHLLCTLPIKSMAPLLVSPERREHCTVDMKTQRITLKIVGKKAGN